MSESLSLEQRVGRAAGEAWLLYSDETLEDRPAEPLGPDYVNDGSSVEQYMALRAAGYADEDLLVFGLTRPRRPATVIVRPEELPKVGSALRLIGIQTSGLDEKLQREQQRGQVVLRLGAADVSYNVRVGTYTGWLGGKRLEVKTAICAPIGLCLTRLGCTALDYCVGNPSKQIRECAQQSGFPGDPQELGLLIEAWNLDPQNTGLPRLPLPAQYLPMAKV